MLFRSVFGIPTAIGCLPSSLTGIVTVILRIATTTAGGIALLIVIISGMKIGLHGENPDEIKKAQKSISSAVVGVLVIVCSLLLLNIIGVKILDIASFGGSQVQFVTTGTK